jgi:hypothetical protein
MKWDNDQEKAWQRFEALCKELESKGVFDLPGEKMQLSKEFIRRVFAIAENPITDEAKKDSQERPLYYLKICTFIALVTFYGKIEPRELEEKWDIVSGLIDLNGIALFQEENR